LFYFFLFVCVVEEKCEERLNREEKEIYSRMFSQQVARSGRRIGQMARGGQQSPFAAIKGAGQRRCYAEAAQGEFSFVLFIN
jgi:hypothetical protein